MRSFYAMVITPILAAGSIAGAGQGQRYIFSGKVGQKLIKPCSRSPVEKTDGFWKPTDAQVDQLESTINACVTHKLLRPISQYHRQYVGIVRKKTKLIYLSAVTTEDGDPKFSIKQPNLLCDGQENAFGVEYRIADGGFQNFEFNGPPSPDTSGAVIKECPKEKK